MSNKRFVSILLDFDKNIVYQSLHLKSKKKVDKQKLEKDFREATSKLEKEFQPILQEYFADQKKAMLSGMQNKSFWPYEKAVDRRSMVPLGIGMVLNVGAVKGGPGSGNFGHEGRPGEVGGRFEKREVKKSFHLKASPGVPDDRFDFSNWSFDKKQWDKRLQQEGGQFIKEMYDKEGNRAYDGLRYWIADLAGAFNIDDPLVQEYLTDYVFTFANNINTTTEELLREAMKSGMSDGLGMSGIAEKIEGLYDTWGKWRSMLIARTETIRASNRAAAMAYRQSGVVSGKEWLVTKDDRLCPLCAPLNGKVIDLDKNFFDKGSEYTIGEADNAITMKLDYEDVGSPPLHPNCLIDHQIPIYTSKGWKPIGKIEVGDLVLTHKGRFRKVTKLHHTPKQLPDVVSIYLDKRHGLSLTANHPIILNGKWREAKEANPGDVILVLASSCAYCGEGIPYYKKYCNHTCLSKSITEKQWSDPIHRENISNKNRKAILRQYADGSRDPIAVTKKAQAAMRSLAKQGLCPLSRPDVIENNKKVTNLPHHRKASSDRMKENNPSKIPEVRIRMTESYKQTLLDHPEKHPNKVMAQRGFISNLEKKVMTVLDVLNLKYEHQFPIWRYFVDFALLDYNVVIETDGEYWHRDIEKDKYRMEDIESLGWTVIRFPGKMINKDIQSVANEIIRITSNHDGRYNFIEMRIESIDAWKSKKTRKLYNLSVEEDESFIAKGLVVHNCRCSLVPWFEGISEMDKSYGLSTLYKHLPGKHDQGRKSPGLSTILKGGRGSGNFGHEGRPGEVGGSGDSFGSGILNITDDQIKSAKMVKEVMEGDIYDKDPKINKSSSQEQISDKIKGHLSFGADDTEMDEERVANYIRDSIHQWAETSGDTNSGSIGMQIAAKDYFDLKDANINHMKKDRDTFDYASYDLDVKRHLPGSRDRQYSLRERHEALLKAQYDATQKYFKEKGITEVIVYRGVQHSDKGMLRNEVIAMQPLSSFSVNVSKAIDFIDIGGDHGPSGTLYAAVLPVNKILSHPGTGFGCTKENEVVVLGGKMKATIIPTYVVEDEYKNMMSSPNKDKNGMPISSNDKFIAGIKWRMSENKGD